MKSLAIIGVVLGCALGSAALAAEQLPSVKYDGKHPVTLHYRDLAVTLDSAPGADAPDRIPVIKGRVGDREVFSIAIDNAEVEAPQAEARVLRLDPHAPSEQVVITAFTGGAHCCMATRIVTADAAGAWRVVSAPDLDGDGYDFVDLAGDGVRELVAVDNDFLYAFECYACSFAPRRVYRLAGTDIEDVTAEPAYSKFLREQVAAMEGFARKDPKLWHSNGFLGGWVAAKSLVGEADAAWARMLKSYDRKSDWSMQECTSGAELDKCPQDKLRDLTFPQALEKLMAQNNYPLPKGAR